mgnify:CR=1 FL=1
MKTKLDKKTPLLFAIVIGLIVLYYGYTDLWKRIAQPLKIVLSIIFTLGMMAWVAFMLGYFDKK